MKKKVSTVLIGICAPLVAFASNEGVPVYYQNNVYQAQNYNGYSPNNKQIIGSRSYSYQVPRPAQYVAGNTGAMTVNGVANTVQSEHATHVYASYNRRFADFEFETGVNSILEWDDMIFNEVTVGARHTFGLRNFDMFAYGEYTYGQMESGGLSMDYDLKPYDESYPEYGVFDVSIGSESGKTHHMKFGIGAHHIWDIGGWKLSPQIGYEIFKHDLEMSDHYYPNPGVYIPMMTDQGTYVFGNEDGFYSVPTNMTQDAEDAGLYQVCLSPQDIQIINIGGSTSIGSSLSYIGETLSPGSYSDSLGTIPWGVGPTDCVVIGGDGPIVVNGTTHIYNTTWSGFYLGLEVEKQMTLSDKLRFYVQVGLPKYSAEGIWPNRDDWQQSPSFLDEGDNGAYSYSAEIEYNYKVSDRLQLALKVDTNYFHVGNISGELYVAEYTDWAYNEDGSIAYDEDGYPYLITEAAHTETISESLKRATWQSFGLHLGVKYAF